jgi:hypothetical protein
MSGIMRRKRLKKEGNKHCPICGVLILPTSKMCIRHRWKNE